MDQSSRVWLTVEYTHTDDDGEIKEKHVRLFNCLVTYQSAK